MHPNKILHSLSIFPKKRLGQNFLINANCILFLKEYLFHNDTILEIGAGLGVITKFLDNEKYNIFSIEKDKKLVEYLKKEYGALFPVFHQDFLLMEAIEIEKNGINTIIGNLPFYISTPIIIKIIKELTFIKKFLIGLQKEYAQRVCLNNINSLGIFANTFGKTRMIKNISRNAYFPTPNVETTWILWERNNTDIDIILFEEFLKGCFWGKRKTIRNNLLNNPFYSKYFLWSHTKEFILSNPLEKCIEEILKKRPDGLPLNLYWELYNYLYKKISFHLMK